MALDVDCIWRSPLSMLRSLFLLASSRRLGFVRSRKTHTERSALGVAEIIEDFPELTEADIQKLCLEFAADREHRLVTIEMLCYVVYQLGCEGCFSHS